MGRTWEEDVVCRRIFSAGLDQCQDQPTALPTDHLPPSVRRQEATRRPAAVASAARDITCWRSCGHTACQGGLAMLSWWRLVPLPHRTPAGSAEDGPRSNRQEGHTDRVVGMGAIFGDCPQRCLPQSHRTTRRQRCTRPIHPAMTAPGKCLFVIVQLAHRLARAGRGRGIGRPIERTSRADNHIKRMDP